MNKEMKAYFIKMIHNDPHSLDGWYSFDTWDCPESAYMFALLKDEQLIIVNGELYFCYFRGGNGICTMGGSPDSVSVTHLDMDKAKTF